jgi:CMP-N,N'-diacetyllegionaminic acid synthase
VRILALIPARGGSKRLPGKNIRLLGEKPLIVWSIDVAKDISEICDILVSTDDPAIAEVCKEAGAYVPWLRPAGLASDTASTVDVALHALDWYEAEKGTVDGLLLLQPTSPFRTKESVRKGIELFKDSSMQQVLAISPTPAHPMWMLKVQDNQMVPFMHEHGFGTRSQDLPPVFVVNGSIYLTSSEDLRMNQSFIGSKISPIIIESQMEALDIDAEWDMALGEFMLKKYNSQLK